MGSALQFYFTVTHTSMMFSKPHGVACAAAHCTWARARLKMGTIGHFLGFVQGNKHCWSRYPVQLGVLLRSARRCGVRKIACSTPPGAIFVPRVFIARSTWYQILSLQGVVMRGHVCVFVCVRACVHHHHPRS